MMVVFRIKVLACELMRRVLALKAFAPRDPPGRAEKISGIPVPRHLLYEEHKQAMNEKIKQLAAEMGPMPEEREARREWLGRRTRRILELFETKKQLKKFMALDVRAMIETGHPIKEPPKKRFFFF
jgi:hypothetical protein